MLIHIYTLFTYYYSCREWRLEELTISHINVVLNKRNDSSFCKNMVSAVSSYIIPSGHFIIMEFGPDLTSNYLYRLISGSYKKVCSIIELVTAKDVNPLPKTALWDRPKFKYAAEDNWNVAGKDTYCIENIVEKGEIAHFEQFHLFPQCFP